MKRCYRADEEPVKAKNWALGGIRLRGVGPAQPAAALRQRMWRSRTELDRALDPDELCGQVGEEVSGAGWRGPGRTSVRDLGREPQVDEDLSVVYIRSGAETPSKPSALAMTTRRAVTSAKRARVRRLSAEIIRWRV